MKILFVQNNNFSDKYFFENFHFLMETILFIDNPVRNVKSNRRIIDVYSIHLK